MPGDGAEDGIERTWFERGVPGNGNSELSVSRAQNEAQVAAGLSDNHVPVASEKLGKGLAAEVSWEFHTGRSSSRTMCSRMIGGGPPFLQGAREGNPPPPPPS